MLPFIRAWAESARGLLGRAVFRGFSRIQECAKAAIAATQRFDFVLSPTAPITAFPAELASPSDDPLHPFPHIGFTVGFNMSGQPAASINCGFDAEGLPIGLQIVGRRFDDVGVLGARARLRGDPIGRNAALAGAAPRGVRQVLRPSSGDLAQKRRRRRNGAQLALSSEATCVVIPITALQRKSCSNRTC